MARNSVTYEDPAARNTVEKTALGRLAGPFRAKTTIIARSEPRAAPWAILADLFGVGEM
jgi:hypothetical protein